MTTSSSRKAGRGEAGHIRGEGPKTSETSLDSTGDVKWAPRNVGARFGGFVQRTEQDRPAAFLALDDLQPVHPQPPPRLPLLDRRAKSTSRNLRPVRRSSRVQCSTCARRPRAADHQHAPGPVNGDRLLHRSTESRIPQIDFDDLDAVDRTARCLDAPAPVSERSPHERRAGASSPPKPWPWR